MLDNRFLKRVTDHADRLRVSANFSEFEIEVVGKTYS